MWVSTCDLHLRQICTFLILLTEPDVSFICITMTNTTKGVIVFN